LPSNNKLRNYSFCFDKEKYCALWVAYPLHECYTEGEGKRTNAWGYDPCCVDDDYEPNLRNAYYPQGGSEYSHSRGHQLPSADRLASNEDNATTFYYSNMTPQLQSLNGGTWASLEDDLRNRWMCSDTLYVVTGAHFEPGYGYAYDQKGAGKACAVPTHYYKVILRTKKGNSGKWVGDCSAGELQCAGFWFVHEGGAQRQIMSVTDIESKTGLTFFTNVPNAPKSTYNASDWQ
jgi:endonuclease G